MLQTSLNSFRASTNKFLRTTTNMLASIKETHPKYCVGYTEQWLCIQSFFHLKRKDLNFSPILSLQYKEKKNYCIMFEILNQYQFLFKEVRNFIQSEN